MTRTRRSTALATVTLLTLAACSSGPFATEELPPRQPRDDTPRLDAGGPGRSVALRSFASCDALLRDLRSEAATLLAGGSFPADVFTRAAAGMPTVETAEDSAAAPASAGGGTASQTNTQEAGVDEGDTVETDGTVVFAASGSTLRVVDVATATVLAAVPLVGDGHDLILAGDRLAVVSGLWDERQALTAVSLYDVTDRANPVLLRRSELEGVVLATRSVDGRVRMVLQSAPAVDLPYVIPSGPGAEEAAAKANEELLADAGIEEWLPTVRVLAVEDVTSDLAVPCDAVSRPDVLADGSMIYVSTLDLAGDGAVAGTAAVVGAGGTVYASTGHLYVAGGTGGFGPVAVQDAAWRSDAIPPPDAPVGPVTDIHAFSLDAAAGAAYIGSATVDGSLLNQFAMSEWEGVLRVATTGIDPATYDSVSSVQTLAVGAGGLRPVGRVDGLGVTETIFAVRFMGPTAYVVTFRQTDPLYVVDLSVAAAPRVVGELKIPGFSSYLHPVGDGLLLGVGQDAGPDGRVLGGQLSLFDVRNPAAPVRTATLATGASGLAAWDHHAFLWWPAGSFAVVPLDDGSAVVVGVDGSLQQRQRLSHPGAGIERALVAADRLVTVSPSGVMVHDLDTFARQAWVAY